jgi:hypothetical protein
MCKPICLFGKQQVCQQENLMLFNLLDAVSDFAAENS